MNKKVYEGLEGGDLDDLVLPLISIDEYSSKLARDSEVIVVAFFVDDLDPANDLSKFILKSAIDIIDTDVSPAPNEEGYYVVFVEFTRNKKFPEKMISMIESINNLTQNNKWQFTPYNSDKLFELDEENLNKKIHLTKKKYEKVQAKKKIKAKLESVDMSTNTKPSLNEWLEVSLLDNYTIDNEKKSIMFERLGMREEYFLAAFGGYDKVVEKLKLSEYKLRVDEYTLWKNRPLSNLLGENYFVSEVGRYLIIGNQYNDETVLAIYK